MGMQTVVILEISQSYPLGMGINNKKYYSVVNKKKIQKQGRNLCKFMDGSKINTNGYEMTNKWRSVKSILNSFYTRNITAGTKKKKKTRMD